MDLQESYLSEVCYTNYPIIVYNIGILYPFMKDITNKIKNNSICVALGIEE